MKLAIIILLFLNNSCTISQKPDLTGCWTSSYEENKNFENNQVYRPCDYKEFPPSRFRFIMDLKSDNSCEYLDISPNDAHYMKSGYWSYDNQTKTITIVDKDKNEVKKFAVKEFKKNILVVENIL